MRLQSESLFPSLFRSHLTAVYRYCVFMAAQWLAGFPDRCFPMAWPHLDDAFRKTSVGGFELRS
jgi:hypothetical protein